MNGCFGIEKDVLVGGDSEEWALSPVLRFIMNLTASNPSQADFHGDMDKLPFIHQRAGLIVDRSMTGFMSTDDIVSMFYIFRLPRGWSKLFVFGEPLMSSDLDMDFNEPVWVASAVVPMGWKNATGVAQYLMRQWALSASRYLPSLPPWP